jgi:protein translocase SecG subunit
MAFLATILPFAQISIAIFLIGSILLQQSDAGLGEMFGGQGSDVGFHTRRGVEKQLFYITAILACAFFVLALVAIIIQ